jgi:hypothetical protein
MKTALSYAQSIQEFVMKIFNESAQEDSKTENNK